MLPADWDNGVAPPDPQHGSHAGRPLPSQREETTLVNIEDVRRHYDALPSRRGFESRCRIELPDGLAGKTALDVCCRRGKGVYKLSERVGEKGRAIGVDWRADYIAAARENAAAALARSGLAENNMAFHVAFPELMDSCVEGGSVDVAFVNDVLNLVFSSTAVLARIREALKPGGVLICQTVVSETPRRPDDIEKARIVGDSVLAAPDRPSFEAWLTDAGFDPTLVEEVERQPVDSGGIPCHEVLLHIRA